MKASFRGNKLFQMYLCYRYYSQVIRGRKTVCKNVKSTITKIGNLALERIYHTKKEPRMDYEREFSVSNSTFDLAISNKQNSFLSGGEGLDHYTKGVTYEAWGIRLGLAEIAVSELSLFDGIVNIVDGDPEQIPSHLVVKEWYNDAKIGVKYSIVVYRLTSEQEEKLKAKV